MTVTVKNIIPRKQLENVQTTQYTASDGRTIIDKFTVTNTTAGAIALAVNLIASGGAAGAANLVLATRNVAPGVTDFCPELVGQILEAGGSVSTLAGAVGLTVSAAGRIVT